MDSLNDPEAVRKAYADENRYATRMAKQKTATGPDHDIVFAAVAEREPRDVLEVGSGRGELAERMSRELSAHVIALDQSARMVELTAARGVEAVIGDVVGLPFDDGSFDCAVAAWMLYHASDLHQALEELRRVLRPGGRLVAATRRPTSISLPRGRPKWPISCQTSTGRSWRPGASPFSCAPREQHPELGRK